MKVTISLCLESSLLFSSYLQHHQSQNKLANFNHLICPVLPHTGIRQLREQPVSYSHSNPSWSAGLTIFYVNEPHQLHLICVELTVNPEEPPLLSTSCFFFVFFIAFCCLLVSSLSTPIFTSRIAMLHACQVFQPISISFMLSEKWTIYILNKGTI